jgi:hypothetical protein
MPEAIPVPITRPPGIFKTEGTRVIEGRWSDAQWVPKRQAAEARRASSPQDDNVLVTGHAAADELLDSKGWGKERPSRSFRK